VFRTDWKMMMEINKPRGGWIGFKKKCTFKTVTKKTFIWIVSQTHIWIKCNQYLINHSLNMILHWHPFFHNYKTWIFMKNLINTWIFMKNLIDTWIFMKKLINTWMREIDQIKKRKTQSFYTGLLSISREANLVI